jgi:hypothetical protein
LSHLGGKICNNGVLLLTAMQSLSHAGIGELLPVGFLRVERDLGQCLVAGDRHWFMGLVPDSANLVMLAFLSP